MGLIHTPYSPTQKPPVGTQIDWGHPLAKGLVVCMPFNEGNGYKYVNLANPSKSGSVISSTYAPLWKTTQKGKCLSFDGSNDVVNLGDFPDITGSISIVASVDFRDEVRASFDTIIAKRDGQNTTTNFAFRRGIADAGSGGPTAPYISFYHYNTDWTIYRETSLSVLYTAAVQTSVTYDGISAPTFYVNNKKGVAAGELGLGTTRPMIANNNNCYIGGVNYADTGQNNESFLGEIYYVYVWKDRILTQNEINQIYQSPYCFLKPTVRRIYSIPVSGGGGWTGPINKRVRFII